MEISQYLRKFHNITTVGRVDDTVIKIVFDGKESLFFDMKKGDAYIFKKEEFKRAKLYNAPFDVALYKRFGRALIEKIEVLEGNRVIRITVNSNSSYKLQKSILQFEFTGRNTNCIILNLDEIVIEALRHIDSSVSYRSVKVGEVLKELPPFSLDEKIQKIENLHEYLLNQYEKRAFVKISQIKKQRVKNIQKKIDKFQNILDKLESEEELSNKAEKYNLWGTLILSNLQTVKAYEKQIELEDFEGKKVCIILPKIAKSPTQAANILFETSKKLKRKAKSLYKERENLEEKIAFFKKMQNAINQAKDEAEINILYPKQKHSKKAKTEQVSYESFFIEGFKVMLGKNEKGNIELLKEAKKRDIWLHLKDIPSSHVIIRTDKQNIPQSVLEFGAKLCVDFSVSEKGSYLVDYTP
ncbi:MAG: NFACT family protein, partial [Campylobacteraceae bacterium]|nr:NFACT family protein [Campylobacteraceae bacterium]